MQLEDYFDFLAPDDIRIKGTRIGIEGVLYEYIHHAQTPEQIAQRFHTVTLEQVYATVLYYLHNHDAVHAYVTDWLEDYRRRRQEQRRNSPPFVEHLRQVKAERQEAKSLDVAQVFNDRFDERIIPTEFVWQPESDVISTIYEEDADLPPCGCPACQEPGTIPRSHGRASCSWFFVARI